VTADTFSPVRNTVIATNNVGLSKLRERSEALEQLRNEPDHSQKAQPMDPVRTESQSHAEGETSTGSPERTTQEGNKRMTCTRSTTSCRQTS
jgi:hypothetical protein